MKIPFLSEYPSLLKVSYLIIGVVIIWLILRILKYYLFSKIQDTNNRYHAKKIGSFVGYFLIFILVIIVYSNRLEGLTVAFGVAGAGIAFALKEVIASFAGWLTIMFGGFYKSGDRVQLGGIKGDVMDIGVLRTTIMETGDWVDGDLYNGRIVLIANSFVFKEPVFNYSGDFPFL
ncbi:MAG: mechanosensitive ion channel domain-containing protein, partial [Bacteroidia bacterium]